jgi:hypothetical protein
LEGTDDFRLTVGPHGHTGAAWFGFVLVELLWAPSRGRHTLDLEQA